MKKFLFLFVALVTTICCYSAKTHIGGINIGIPQNAFVAKLKALGLVEDNLKNCDYDKVQGKIVVVELDVNYNTSHFQTGGVRFKSRISRQCEPESLGLKI